MTKLGAVLAACLLLVCGRGAIAQSSDIVTVTRAFTVPPNSLTTREIYCPAGYYTSGITFKGTNTSLIDYINLDAQGREFLFTGATLQDSAGYKFTLRTTAEPRDYVLVVICKRRSSGASATAEAILILAGGTAKVDGLCDPGKVPVGQISNADGRTLVQRSRAYIFLSGGNYSFLEDAPDGESAPPVGIQLEVSNATSTTQTLHVQTACQPLPGARAFVSSADTTPGVPFSLAGLFPDALDFAGFSAVGGLFGSFRDIAIWGKDGSVSNQARFASPSGTLPLTEVRNIFIDGVDVRPQSGTKASPRAGTEASARAVIGIVAVPRSTPPPAPNIVTVVEFYNQALDHYFITASPDEITKLDTGVFVGWQRTQQSFKAYGPGSSGPPGRRPVCREYGDPLVGLDSHFYSASPAECLATLVSFNGAWLFEASEVFQMQLPDILTGTCPAGSGPVYRLWNQRADSNHRYVTTIALRDQMAAKGYVPEGYGPNSVTLCAVQ